MKRLAIIIGVLLTVSGAATASEFESSRMLSGAKFAEQQTDKKMDSASSPVEIDELSEVKEAECNAKAKNYGKLTKKAPPALKNKVDADNKKDSKVAEVAGAVTGSVAAGVGGVLTGVIPYVGYAAGVAAGSAVVGVAAATVAVMGIAAAGAAIGYGVVHAVKKI